MTTDVLAMMIDILDSVAMTIVAMTIDVLDSIAMTIAFVHVSIDLCKYTWSRDNHYDGIIQLFSPQLRLPHGLVVLYSALAIYILG